MACTHAGMLRLVGKTVKITMPSPKRENIVLRYNQFNGIPALDSFCLAMFSVDLHTASSSTYAGI